VANCNKGQKDVNRYDKSGSKGGVVEDSSLWDVTPCRLADSYQRSKDS